MALRKYNGCHDITMDIMRDEDGEIIPAMPDDPFMYRAELLSMWRIHAVRGSYYEQSLCFRYEVSNVPPKPVFHKVNNDKHRRAVLGDTSTLSTHYAKGKLPINIGSNMGLARIMRDHYEEKKQHLDNECTSYTAFNADINIFDRVAKVCFL